MQGIYALKIDGRAYIGSSKNIKGRFASHKSQLKCNSHINKYLQKAYKEKQEIKLVVLEEVKNKHLLTYYEGLWMLSFKKSKVELFNTVSMFIPNTKIDTTVIVYELLTKLDITLTELSKKCGFTNYTLKFWMSGYVTPANWNISKLYRYYFEVFGELPKVYRSCSNCKYLNKKNECKKDWVYYKRDIYLRDDYLKDTIHTQNCDYYRPSVYNKAKIDRLYDKIMEEK